LALRHRSFLLQLHVPTLNSCLAVELVLEVATVFAGHTSKRLPGAGRIAIGVLFLGLWLGAAGFSSSAWLHERVCADANQVSHDCAVSTLAKGHFAAPPVPPPVPAPRANVPSTEVSFETLFLTQIDLRLSPGRAPPSAFFIG
jgi:hypothetical protein